MAYPDILLYKISIVTNLEKKMKQAKYNVVSGIVFLVFGLCAVLKIGYGWETTVNGVPLPGYVEYSVAAVALIMAYSAFKHLK